VPKAGAVIKVSIATVHNCGPDQTGLKKLPVRLQARSRWQKITRTP
jgi:hypothetical protein